MKTIFCLPYAGGAASAYGELKKIAHTRGLELVPMEYAGRASRMALPFYGDLYEAAQDCYQQLKLYFSKHYVPCYGIFGHSMGSWVLYEMMRLIQEKQELPAPDVLFSSGNTIPQLRIQERMSDLSEDEFWEQIYRLGGLEKELYEMPEFKEYILPVLKNDYRILEDYAGSQVKEFRLHAKLCVLAGRKDNITEEECRQWGDLTDQPPEIRWFAGDHFYFRQEGSALVDYFCEQLQHEI